MHKQISILIFLLLNYFIFCLDNTVDLTGVWQKKVSDTSHENSMMIIYTADKYKISIYNDVLKNYQLIEEGSYYFEDGFYVEKREKFMDDKGLYREVRIGDVVLYKHGGFYSNEDVLSLWTFENNNNRTLPGTWNQINPKKEYILTEFGPILFKTTYYTFTFSKPKSQLEIEVKAFDKNSKLLTDNKTKQEFKILDINDDKWTYQFSLKERESILYKIINDNKKNLLLYQYFIKIK